MTRSAQRSRASAVLVALGAVFSTVACTGEAIVSPTVSSPSETGSSPASDGLLHLDPSHDYGDRYADGVLPVGDERWSLTTPAVGTIFLCNDNFVPDEQAGAQSRGPWFLSETEWDSGSKISVQGSVDWQSQLSIEVSGEQRLIATNDLPTHPTGSFPVSASDPARFYDANPNTISAQQLDYAIDAAPDAGAPSCMGGEVGVMLTGVSLFNGFDAGGRDAGAWEVQDSCDGHPQGAGQYHYHSLSQCIDDLSVTTVLGWALDGFAITGPVVGEHNVLTTSDLDECHGLVSEIELDGALVETYHYVMTQDFPYSVSCFRGTPTQAPGQPGGQAPPDGPPGGQQGPPPPPSGGAP